MITTLDYGTTGLQVDLGAANVTTLSPVLAPGLADERAGFTQAVRNPIDSAPLREVISAHDRVAVVIPDITRALPAQRLLSWLFSELSHVPAANFTIVNGTGSHRANTPEELARMVGSEIVTRYRVVNHNAYDPATLALAGQAPAFVPAGDGVRREGEAAAGGRSVYFNREYVEADKRIALGFIEPHFMAGFSGGYKAVMPALADIESIMYFHRAAVIGDARSTWGRLEDNPTQELIRAYGSLLPLHFCLNVTLNRQRGITGFFCGEVMAAHRTGAACAKRTAMVPCRRSFPIVLTSNSGYPLDQNLYQSVKGMSAAAQIVTPGGLILIAARCDDGFPEHGNFKKFLFAHRSPQSMLDAVCAPGFTLLDQWQIQLLALILLKCRVGVYSQLAAEEIRRAHLEPVADLGVRVQEELSRIAQDAPVAVLPEGPQTIPYLA